MEREYSVYGTDVYVTPQIARARLVYDAIRNSTENFRVMTLNGVDDDSDGMRERVMKDATDPYAGWEVEDSSVLGEFEHFGLQPPSVYQGFKYGDMPTTYAIGDNRTYAQQ